MFGSVSEPLLILDLANNHNGSVAHGKAIIDSAAEALEGIEFPAAIKFQYRDLDTLIHPDFKGNYDFKYIKRFEETRITDADYLELVAHARERGFLAACTPFDEISVQKVVDHGFDFLKIASACATDWPLLTAVAEHTLPVIVSTGGLTIRETDRVAAFMTKRVDRLALMHCVAIYPTPDKELALNRIDLLKGRYKGVTVGYSTHEDPNNVLAGSLALAKGAHILERHVGLEAEGMSVNAYSSQAAELRAWATRLREAAGMMSGMDEANYVNQAELDSVRALRRGVYARDSIVAGSEIDGDAVMFAIPVLENQITANMWSKLESKSASAGIAATEKLTTTNVTISDRSALLRELVERSRLHFESAGITVPNRSAVELSHHYGLARFDEFGIVMVTVVNRDYCKKVIGVFPGQFHPEHVHKKKEETFICMSGTLILDLDGKKHTLKAGDIMTVEVGVRHSFSSPDGAVFEEISSTHFVDDSYYTDESINSNAERKTKLSVWSLAD
ncbi:MAG: sialic acid synthase SpsE/quercetin dioxygenase-like cupin family protein [Pontimonas sp.]